MLKTILEDLITHSSDKKQIMGTLDSIYNDIVHTYAEVEEKNHSSNSHHTHTHSHSNHSSVEKRNKSIGNNGYSNGYKNNSNNSNVNSKNNVDNNNFHILRELQKDNEDFKARFNSYEAKNEKIAYENFELKKQLIEQNNMMLNLQKEMIEIKSLLINKPKATIPQTNNPNTNSNSNYSEKNSAKNSDKDSSNKQCFLNLPVKKSTKKVIQVENKHVNVKIEDKIQLITSPINTDLLTTTEEKEGMDIRNNGNNIYNNIRSKYYFK